MKSLWRIKAIIFKELVQLRRDHMTFAMIVMIPIVQLVLFGYAINTNIRHVPAGIIDLSQTELSRRIVETVKATQIVDFVESYHSVAEGEIAITRGDVKAVLIIPADLNQRYQQYQAWQNGQYPPQHRDTQREFAQWIADGTDITVANVIKSLRNLPVLPLPKDSADNRTPNRFQVVLYFNPEQRTPVHIVPGLVAVILNMTMVMFTSSAIVRERERGNLEFLIATPVRPMELMIGKIFPYLFVGLLQMGLILGVGYLLFDVPMIGSVWVLLSTTLLFVLSALTLGLFISTVAKTQRQSMQMTIFVMLPSILLSGFMFPYVSMPKPAQWIAEILPVTHFVRMVRGVVLKDAGWSDFTSDALWLVGFMVVMLVISMARFKKRLD
ncbi:putative multidrug ABC transporter permease YbhS [BD1-7 clade bacterium]|uniref:Transport permease protein n=1 Tax=BD1-7 clade bacterium TaxID=2029982 RepID=A0A5S9QS27_9GAMM|nr:putative multidrug ABC transporter permease YbhS [BD1-7 clade bacterium]CAA0122077.1 putative multidrug ABC transporter permease YbhS [BD1-7 clade bacterium]